VRRQSTLVIVIANEKKRAWEYGGVSSFSQIKATEALHLLGKKKGSVFQLLGLTGLSFMTFYFIHIQLSSFILAAS